MTNSFYPNLFSLPELLKMTSDISFHPVTQNFRAAGTVTVWTQVKP